MSFLQQVIDLLSRPPGSVIFHLLTLFALQVVLALAFAHWRRDPNDERARRMTFAAGGILLARLLLLLVALLVGQNARRALVILPPLEQAIDTATVLLLVWGLSSFALDRPRLADGVLLVSLVVVTVMFLFFLQDWQVRSSRAADVPVAYISTVQAYIWGILQMAILAVGLVGVLLDRSSRLTLRPIIVGVVLLAHIAYFFNYPELVPTNTEVVYWLRLGYLIAFPLWAVLAYHESMQGLMTVAEAEREQADLLTRNLELSTDVISTRIPQLRLEQALDMLNGLIPAQFTTIGLIDEKNPQRVLFSQSRPSTMRESTYGWQINLSDHAAFRLAYEQQRGIELLPRGVGARQVYELSQQFNTGALGAVYVEPLVADNQCLGFLLLGAPPSVQNWSERDRAVIPGVAAFLAQAITNSRRLEQEAPSRPVSPAAALVERDGEKEQLIVELAGTRRQLAALEDRVRQAEAVAVYYQQREPGQPTVARTQAAQAVVAKVIDSAVGSLLPLLREKNLKLDVAVKPDLPLVAVKEPVLKQLVISLLENAGHASKADSSVLLRADVAAQNGVAGNGPGSVVLAFTDSGAGIRPDERTRVFDPQYYVEGNRSLVGVGGNGVNLAMVQKLAQAGGGDLELESKAGGGTTFLLRLPAAELRPWSMMKLKPESAALQTQAVDAPTAKEAVPSTRAGAGV